MDLCRDQSDAKGERSSPGQANRLPHPDCPSPQRLKEIACRLDGVVAVVGDYMLDEYLFGAVSRISPEAPVPVVEFARESSSLGGAGNVVANISALGGRPVPFGFVGDDAPGRQVLEALEPHCPHGAKHMLTGPADRPTTVKLRIIAHHQQLLRVDRESRSPIPESLHASLLASLTGDLERSLSGIQAIVVSDYDKGAITRSFFQSLLQAALAAGVPVVLDPKAFDLTAIGPATVITPNEKEAERFSGIRITGDDSANSAGERLLALTGARHILITRGEHGMSLYTRHQPSAHMPAEAREVYDVTGAGDTVAATLSLALAAGAEVAEAAMLANFAAGVVVGKLGTASVSREDLIAALDGAWRPARQPK